MTDRPPLPPPDSPEWTKSAVTKRCRHGEFAYLPQDAMIGRALDLYGEVCEPEARLFRTVVAPGAVVVEAGANIGAFTVVIAEAAGVAGRVIAYEPQAPLFELLRWNIGRNTPGNVELRRAAMGAAAGTTRVPWIDYQRGGNFGGVAVGTTDGYQVFVETIDGLALERLDFVKIDVEGAEFDVLAGGRRTIARLRPLLYVEADRTDKSGPVIALLLELGYALWWHVTPMFSPDNFFGNGVNVFDAIVSINILATPVERGITVAGATPVTGPDDDWVKAQRRRASTIAGGRL